MADTKISGLSALTDPASADELVAVDKSDTSMAATGTDKKLTIGSLPPSQASPPPTGITYQNFDRQMTVSLALTNALTSASLRMAAIWLPQGFTVTSISFMSGSTALVTSGVDPHFWVALYDSSLALLRQSTDQTSATWAANTLKTTNLSSTFTTTYGGVHYLGLLVKAGSTGTQPTLTVSNMANTQLIGLPPITHGTSSTGLTATAPNPAAALTANASVPYCGVA